jgi:hypothetical protein
LVQQFSVIKKAFLSLPVMLFVVGNFTFGGAESSGIADFDLYFSPAVVTKSFHG